MDPSPLGYMCMFRCILASLGFRTRAGQDSILLPAHLARTTTLILRALLRYKQDHTDRYNFLISSIGGNPGDELTTVAMDGHISGKDSTVWLQNMEKWGAADFDNSTKSYATAGCLAAVSLLLPFLRIAVTHFSDLTRPTVTLASPASQGVQLVDVRILVDDSHSRYVAPAGAPAGDEAGTPGSPPRRPAPSRTSVRKLIALCRDNKSADAIVDRSFLFFKSQLEQRVAEVIDLSDAGAVAGATAAGDAVGTAPVAIIDAAAAAPFATDAAVVAATTAVADAAAAAAAALAAPGPAADNAPVAAGGAGDAAPVAADGAAAAALVAAAPMVPAAAAGVAHVAAGEVAIAALAAAAEAAGGYAPVAAGQEPVAAGGAAPAATDTDGERRRSARIAAAAGEQH